MLRPEEAERTARDCGLDVERLVLQLAESRDKIGLWKMIDCCTRNSIFVGKLRLSRFFSA